MDAAEVKGKVDFGIITIREDELAAVLEKLSDVIGTATGRRLYNLRRVETVRGDAYTVAILRCAEQGNSEAQDAARDLMEELDPQWLLVVGIAGGVPSEELTLGDVVVSTRIVDFSLEAANRGGPRELAIAGGPVHRAVTRVGANLPAMRDQLGAWGSEESLGMKRPEVKLTPRRQYGDAEWKKKVRTSIERHSGEEARRSPKVVTGAIASSDRLVKDDELLRGLQHAARQILAVEMESAGIYRATSGRGVPFAAIRGISDLVGLKRDPAWTAYACRSAAAFTLAFLRARPIPPIQQHSMLEETLTPPVELGPAPRFTHCIGRDDVIDAMVEHLQEDHPAPIALVGSAGIGKSTIALAVMDRAQIRRRYGDRRWFVRMDAATSAESVLAGIAGAVGLKGDGDLRFGLKKALGHERGLLVLDNIETPLTLDLRATEMLLAELGAIELLGLLVTSRGSTVPGGPTWGRIVKVEPLDNATAQELFLTIAPEHRDRGDVTALLEPLGGVPLAVTLLGHAAQGNTFENLRQEWSERQTDILERDGTVPDRSSSWQVSLEISLGSPRMTDEARRLASLLAMLPDGMAQGDLAALLPGAGASAARVLSQGGLAYFEEGRIRQLAPVRLYLARKYPPGTEDVHQVMDRYRKMALSLGAQVGRPGGGEAVARLDAERNNIEIIIRRGLTGDEAPYWIDIVGALVNYMRHTGRLDIAMIQLANAAALERGDRRREARTTRWLAMLSDARSQVDEAIRLHEIAADLFHREGDRIGEAASFNSLGDIEVSRSNYEKALKALERARHLFKESKSAHGEANCLASLGELALRHRDHELSRKYFEDAVVLYRNTGQRLDQANMIRRLGELALERATYEEASHHLAEALAIYDEVGGVQGSAATRFDLARLALMHTNWEEAAAGFSGALAIMQQVGDVGGQANCYIGLGDVALQNGTLDTARASFEVALQLFQRVSDQEAIGDAHCRLARLGRVAGDPAEEERHLRAARAAWTSLGRTDLLAEIEREFATALPTDRIAELRIAGLRTIDELTLRLDGLVVLIGENGSGKSTILEACELLRRAAGPEFLSELNAIHGGLFLLLRHGAPEFRLGARIEGDGPPLTYEIAIAPDAAGAVIAAERLLLERGDGSTDPSQVIIDRDRREARIREPGNGIKAISVGSTQSILGAAGLFSPHPAIQRAKRALEGIAVHLPFEVLSAWAARDHDRRAVARGPILLQPTDRVERLGGNLANVYHALRTRFDEDHWQTTMEYVRLGLGDSIESVNTVVQEGGGAVALSLKLRGHHQQIPAAAISDGALAYLAFVGLSRLEPRGRSLLAFDEPEAHMNPSLLARVLQLLESAAERHPVLLATHSDRLLDLLQEPARSVRVCELEGDLPRTRLRELDADALREWLDGYRGVGDLRSAGYLDTVLKPRGEA